MLWSTYLRHTLLVKVGSASSMGWCDDSSSFIPFLIWRDRRSSRGYSVSKPTKCLNLDLLLICLYCSLQHLQSPGPERAADIFLWILQDLVISALFSQLSLSHVCHNIPILVFFQCTRRTWEDRRLRCFFPPSCINSTRLTETLNTALNAKNKTYNWLQVSSQGVALWQ